MIFVFQLFGVRLGSQAAQEIGRGTAGWLGWILFFVVLFILAFMEEVLFRFPLFFVALIVFGKKWPLSVNLWSIVILSAIFGYLHGNWINIFIQGGDRRISEFRVFKGRRVGFASGKGAFNFNHRSFFIQCRGYDFVSCSLKLPWQKPLKSL